MSVDPSTMNSGELAFVGDAVYSLLVRSELVTENRMRISELHPASVKVVCAEAQAAAAELVIPLLSEEEIAIYTKGRNMKHGSYPKHGSHGDYARATGLECLFGWLHLSGRQERINELYAVIRNGRNAG